MFEDLQQVTNIQLIVDYCKQKRVLLTGTLFKQKHNTQ